MAKHVQFYVTAPKHGEVVFDSDTFGSERAAAKAADAYMSAKPLVPFVIERVERNTAGRIVASTLRDHVCMQHQRVRAIAEGR